MLTSTFSWAKRVLLVTFFVLITSIALASAPTIAHAEILGDFVITGTDTGYNFDNSTRTLTVTGSGDYEIKMNFVSETTDSITITGDATITLNNVWILNASGPAIHVYNNSKVTFYVVDTNQMTTISTYHAAIQVDAGSTLIIDSKLPLLLEPRNQISGQTDGYGAGIGSAGDDGTGTAVAGGDLIFNGGIVYATTSGGYTQPAYAAAIGSGRGSSIGNITINGGRVTGVGSVKMSSYAAGIGAGQDGSCGDITVNGGFTIAYSTQGKTGTEEATDALGAGKNGSCGAITITGGSVRAFSTSTSSSTCMTKVPTNGTTELALVEVAILGGAFEEFVDSATFTYVDDLRYNTKDMFLAPGGKAYFWLPVGTYTAAVVVNGSSYTGLVNVLSDNTAVTALSNSQIAVKLVRDGQIWQGHSKTITLRASQSQGLSDAVIEGTLLSNGTTVFDAQPAGLYDIYDDNLYTGSQLSVGTASAIGEVAYYSVTLNARAAGTTTSASITAQSDGRSIAPNYGVIAGHDLVLTGVGDGALTYTYAWEGTGIAGKTDETVAIAQVNAPVDVACTITGYGVKGLPKAGDTLLPSIAMLVVLLAAAGVTATATALKRRNNN